MKLIDKMNKLIGSGFPRKRINTYFGCPAPEEKRTIDLTPQLKDIFYGRKGAEYAAATLIFKDLAIKDSLIMMNMWKGINDEEDFWMAMNYVKYKSNTSVYYDRALQLIKNRDDMTVEVAKLFLIKEIVV